MVNYAKNNRPEKFCEHCSVCYDSQCFYSNVPGPSWMFAQCLQVMHATVSHIATYVFKMTLFKLLLLTTHLEKWTRLSAQIRELTQKYIHNKARKTKSQTDE